MEISDAISLFIDYCGTTKKLSTYTLKAYSADLKGLLRFDAKEVTCIHDTDLISRVTRSWLGNPDLKPATIKRRIATLKVFVRWLHREKHIPVFPEQSLSITVKLPRRLPRNLRTSEMRKLVAFSPENSLIEQGERGVLLIARRDWDQWTARLAIEIMTLTGVRVGELTKVKPSDIDHGARKINVLGKGNRERRVFFPDQVTSTRIRRYSEHAKRRFGSTAEEPLLRNGLGRSASEQYLRRVIRTYATAMKVERRVTPHMLRHTAATQLLEAGVDIRLVQKLLGHASITTTEVYTHVADRHLHQKITKVNVRKRLERTIDN